MKFNIFLACAALFCLSFLSCQQPKKGLPTDATFLGIEERQKNDQGFATNSATFESKLKAELDRNKLLGERALPIKVITIPVVAHVVQPAGAAPISDQQISTQIEQLNRDFRRNNTDELDKIPEAFRVLAADTRIQFVLARRTPDAKASNGILRATAGKDAFEYMPLANSPEARNPVKFKTSGGEDAWPSDAYLNLWICKLNKDAKEGYASLVADFPDRASEDGVVLNSDYLSTSIPGRNKGRVLTNLVAKWLGLKDIWGMGTLNGSDEVEDTPVQDGPNQGLANYPYFKRAASPYGDLYCNFMDATNDEQRIMFTAGQADRMYAVLQTQRAGMRDSEGGMAEDRAPAAGIDHFIEDQVGDTGTEPNPLPGPYYYAEGIAVNQNSTATDMTQTGAIVQVGAAITNYIHVRVKRTGAGAPPPSEVLHVYYADASTGNNDWYDATRWTEIGSGYSTYTGWIANTRYINPPITLPASLPSSHICLIARLEQEAQSCPDRSCNGSPGHPLMALGTYARDNNNTAWQNLDIVASRSSGGNAMGNEQGPRTPGSESRFANFSAKPVQARLVFSNLPNETPIFNFGKVALSGKRLLELWDQSGRVGDGVEQIDSQLVVTKAGAFIGLTILPGESNRFKIKFLGNEKTPNLRDIYQLNLEQQEPDATGKYTTKGGVVFALKAEHGEMPPPPPDKNDWWKGVGLALAAVLAFWLWQRSRGTKYAEGLKK